MTESTLYNILKQAPFLAGMADGDLHRVAATARLDTYPAGGVLFREGQAFGRIFLVVEGSVALELDVPDHGGRRVHTVRAGELLGWSPILGPTPMTATARALTLTCVVALNGSQILYLCEQDPKFGLTFMRRTAAALADRLQATRVRLVELYGHELPVVAGIHEGAD
jgi:CRP/FNR family transcriptional regulator, cyclic AMP receptor protein